MLDFDAFRAAVAGIAGVEVERVAKDAALVDDLGFDSIRMVELLAALADLGVDVPEDATTGVDTVGQVFDIATAPRPAGSAAGIPAPPETGNALETRRLRLRPVAIDDHPFLYALATSPDIGWRLRSRGIPMNADEFVGQLHRGVLAQFVVDDVRAGQRVGIVQAHDGNLIDGHARVTVAVRPEQVGSGWGVEALGMFVSYLFATFPLRKVYAEVPEFAWPSVASGEGRTFEVEGRYRGHRYAGGRWWDVNVVAIRRDEWEASGEPRIAVVRNPAGTRGGNA